MPVVPLQRPDELNIPSPSWMQTSSGYEDASNEQGIPTMITWSYGGKEVSVEGSWDSWKSRLLLDSLVLLSIYLLIIADYEHFKSSSTGSPCRDQGKTSPS